jgi:alanine dehydrogenase
VYGVDHQVSGKVTYANASVYALDTELPKLEALDHAYRGNVITALATQHNVEKFSAFAEVLVGAVRQPGGGAPQLVTRDMVRKMKRGAVILDFAINEGGCVETSRLTPTEDGVFVQDGIVHYALREQGVAPAYSVVFSEVVKPPPRPKATGPDEEIFRLIAEISSATARAAPLTRASVTNVGAAAWW